MKAENIIQTFRGISHEFKDKVGGPKVAAISRIFQSQGLDMVFEPGVGMICNDIKNPKAVLVAHMDLVPPFVNGFREIPRRVYDIYSVKKKKGVKTYLRGALDNTFCNAVAIHVFLKLHKEGLANDITLLFSEGEEIDQHGVKNFIKSREVKDSFFLNLDVTPEGWGKSMSVEYDRPNFQMLKQITSILTERNAHYTGKRMCDDTDAVLGQGCSGLSFCIPTKDDMHSYENKLCYASIEPYANALYDLLSKIDFSIDFKADFHPNYLEEALESKDMEELSEKFKKNNNDTTISYLEDDLYESEEDQLFMCLDEVYAAFGEELFNPDYFTEEMINLMQTASFLSKGQLVDLIKDCFDASPKEVIKALLEEDVLREVLSAGKEKYYGPVHYFH